MKSKSFIRLVEICYFATVRYDFWYQPYHNVMISTEWGHPRSFFQGLNMEHVEGVRP